MGAVTASAIFSLSLNSKVASPKDSKPIDRQEPEIYIPDCDWVVENVFIVDGSGQSSIHGKIAVKGENIAATGDFKNPAGIKVIDGRGLVASPGFIDIHTHTEDYFYSGESMAPFLTQGVTTQVGGNCGRSPRDIAGFFRTVPSMAINYGLLLGYRTLREMAGVNNNKRASMADITKMQKHLVQALEAGALGLSTGLEYAPQHLATTEELTTLCHVVKQYGGFYATHLRSEYNGVIPALEEAIKIGQTTGVSVQNSHIKAGHEENWAKFPKLLNMLESASSSGLDITADVYPYTFSSTDIGIKPLRHSISEENLNMAITHPLVFIGSDTGIYSGGRANHPRAYGTYPRVLGRMVREKGLLSLEEAIAKMTSQPAKRLKLKNRGLLQTGYKADIVLLDPKTIIDKATIENPAVFSEGIQQVWVNGALSWDAEVKEDNKGQAL
jgi:N-acyl-D-aspartate/D-glutamate deacylase